MTGGRAIATAFAGCLFGVAFVAALGELVGLPMAFVLFGVAILFIHRIWFVR